MTNATETVLNLPAGDVQQVIASELSRSQAVMQSASAWFASHCAGFVVNVVVALLVLAVGAFAIRYVRRAIQAVLNRIGDRDSILDRFILSVVHKLCWALLILLVVQRLGINTAPLVAGLGVTGFILGFAFKEALGNLASGMMIAINQPFRVGDSVTVGSAVSGVVKDINMMAVTVKTSDGVRITVPNNVIWGAPITNFSATNRRRFEIPVGVAYGADLAKAKRVALETMLADPRVLRDPAPIAEVAAMGESSVNLVLRAWAAPRDYWAAFWTLTQAVKEAFDANGIEIPFPQLDVRMKNG